MPDDPLMAVPVLVALSVPKTSTVVPMLAVSPALNAKNSLALMVAVCDARTPWMRAAMREPDGISTGIL